MAAAPPLGPTYLSGAMGAKAVPPLGPTYVSGAMGAKDFASSKLTGSFIEGGKSLVMSQAKVLGTHSQSVAASSTTAGSPGGVSELSEAASWGISFARLERVAERATDTLTDIQLVTCFLELSQLPVVPHVDSSTMSLMMQTLNLLHMCGYPKEDVCTVLAHASAYFVDVYSQRGQRMASGEAGYILVVLIYIGHSYVLDENCPLIVWHQKLLKKYCTMDMLDKAVLRLMQLRRYILRIDEEDMRNRCGRLLACGGLSYGTKVESVAGINLPRSL